MGESLRKEIQSRPVGTWEPVDAVTRIFVAARINCTILKNGMDTEVLHPAITT